MDARWPVHIAGVDHEVVVFEQSLQVELCRIRLSKRMRARMPVSIGLLNVWTVVAASAILLHPDEAIFVGQMVANTVFILRLHADAERIAVWRYVACLRAACWPCGCSRWSSPSRKY